MSLCSNTGESKGGWDPSRPSRSGEKCLNSGSILEVEPIVLLMDWLWEEEEEESRMSHGFGMSHRRTALP